MGRHGGVNAPSAHQLLLLNPRTEPNLRPEVHPANCRTRRYEFTGAIGVRAQLADCMGGRSVSDFFGRHPFSFVP
jgi:hypothetical protein